MRKTPKTDAEIADIIERLFRPNGDKVRYDPPPAVPIIRIESAVYFVAVRGYIKIGWTTDWRGRLSNLRVSNPEPIEVLLILGRPQIFEKTMHRQFAEHRAHGEWFRDHPDIRAYIDERKDECWYRAGRRK